MTTELNTEAATPLYKQLEETLRTEIENGSRPVGSRLPTENELSKTYNVSRVTVRKALDALTKGNYLDRRPGKGTFVAEKKIQRGLSGVLSFTDMCREMGFKPGARTLMVMLRDPSEQEAKDLELQPDEQILVIERLRLADDRPVQLETNYFPERFDFLFNENLNDTSLYSLIKERRNVIYTQSSKTMEIVYASSQEAKKLQVPKGHPLLCINSVVQDESGQNLQLCCQLCIADKFKLKI